MLKPAYMVGVHPTNTPVHNHPIRSPYPLEVDCPRCQAVITIDNPEEAAFCPQCNAALSLEMGGAGFALVSAADEDPDGNPPPPPPEEEELTALNDAVLADHMRWKVGALFAIIFGLIILGCAGYSGFHDYSKLGKAAVFEGREAFWLWTVGGIGLFLVAVGGGLFGLSTKETRRYMAYMEDQRSPTSP